MTSMRAWFGIGTRRYSIALIVQPMRWRWQVWKTPTVIQEVYLGPFTIQVTKP
jgi:hypothetical protein